jgi:hypothetical protein
MSFTPFQNILMRTNLTYEEVCKRLDEAIGDTRGINLIAGRSEPYLGTFKKDHFRVVRDSSSLQLVKPVIKGNVMKAGSGSYVHLNMRPGILADIVLVVSFILSTASLIERLISAILENVNLIDILADSIVRLAGIFMVLVIVYTSITISIRIESEKSKKFFIDLIEAFRVEDLGIKSRKQVA